jgi:hypothetical protein
MRVSDVECAAWVLAPVPEPVDCTDTTMVEPRHGPHSWMGGCWGNTFSPINVVDPLHHDHCKARLFTFSEAGRRANGMQLFILSKRVITQQPATISLFAGLAAY